MLGRGAYGRVRRDGDVALKQCVTAPELLPSISFVREAVFHGSVEAAGVRGTVAPIRVPDRVLPLRFMETTLEALDMPVNGAWRKRCLVQLLMALARAHARGVTHRDVKPANILVDTDGSVALGDWGMCSFERQPTTPHMVTLWYRPPEMFGRGGIYNCSADLWSLGMVALQMRVGRVPVTSTDDSEFFASLRRWYASSPDLDRVERRLLMWRARDRGSADAALTLLMPLTALARPTLPARVSLYSFPGEIEPIVARLPRRIHHTGMLVWSLFVQCSGRGDPVHYKHAVACIWLACVVWPQRRRAPPRFTPVWGVEAVNDILMRCRCDFSRIMQ